MDVDTYVDEGEEIRCRTTTKDTDESAAGTLAVTDRRIVHVTESDSLLDTLTIPLSEVEDVTYEIEPVKWVVVALGVAIAAAGVAWHLFSPVDIPFIAFTLVTVVLVLFGAVVAFDGFNTRTETLRIVSGDETHVFEGGSFSAFPDAIREE